MSFGDVKFGNVAASGHVEGTGADLFIACKFNPQWVIVTNTNAATQLYWTQTMADGSGVKFGAGGTGAITPASAGTPSGTNTAPAFTGTPAVLTGTNSTPTFTGSALPTHIHAIPSSTKNETFTLYRVYYGSLAGGPFVVGETVTGAPSTATGVVTAVAGDHLDFAAATGFLYNDTLTGGTSGATATATSSGLAIMTSTPMVGFLGASGTYASNAGTEPFIKGAYILPLQGRTRSIRFALPSFEVEFAPDYLNGGALTSGRIDYLETPTLAASAGTPTGTVSAPALTMNSYTPVGTVAAPAFTGTPMSNHTHAFTGAGGAIVIINTGGITPGTSGFNIGTDVDINVLGANLYWLAGR